MLIAVETPDAESAMTLVQRLVHAVGGEAVSLPADAGEVHVEATHDTDRVLAETLDAVDAWLAGLQLDHARVRCDGRTQVLERRRPARPARPG